MIQYIRDWPYFQPMRDPPRRWWVPWRWDDGTPSVQPESAPLRAGFRAPPPEPGLSRDLYPVLSDCRCPLSAGVSRFPGGFLDWYTVRWEFEWPSAKAGREIGFFTR